MKNLVRLGLVVVLLALFVAGGAQAQSKPKVLLKTNMGNVIVELEPAKAPKTVANFLAYVRQGHYDGTIFHRVIASFMAQGGGFTQDFQRLPTRKPIQNEADNGLQHDRGTIAMARTSDVHSATDQFFINLKFNGFLNHRSKTDRGWGYTVFGHVTQGMNIVGRIGRVATGAAGPFGQDVPQKPVILEKATIISE
ncbi:MAG: peptidyl-prolyl cis-trans isomerase [Rhodospirillales bacterium]|nr:peptidyl-prolyl cis-trans isomerase [Rhodospirillales bacterium]